MTPLGPGQTEKSVQGNPGPTTASTPGSVLDNTNGEVMMASLRNKNKRKNFRQTMVAPAVRKIVFGDDTGDARPAHFTASASIQEPNSAGLVRKSLENSNNDIPTVSGLQMRIVPPSTLAAMGLLPPNILVTSVEFGRQGKNNRRSWDTCEEEQVAHEVQQFDSYGHDADDGNVYLPYGEDGDDGQGGAVEQSAQFDWTAAERGWEHFSLIETPDQLYAGVLVCWQVSLSSTFSQSTWCKIIPKGSCYQSTNVHSRTFAWCRAGRAFAPLHSRFMRSPVNLGKSGGYFHYYSTNIKARDRNCRGVWDRK